MAKRMAIIYNVFTSRENPAFGALHHLEDALANMGSMLSTANVDLPPDAAAGLESEPDFSNSSSDVEGSATERSDLRSFTCPICETTMSRPTR